MARTQTLLQLAALSTAAWLFIPCCAAQDARPPFDQMGHQAWSTEEGLPQSSVHSILQTKNGYIWIATEAGLARFDSIGFRVFDSGNEPALQSDDICCLAEQPANNLWIGTADGLVRLADGRMSRFGVPEGLPSNTVLSLLVTNGSLLAETSAGWAQWNGHRFERSTPPSGLAMHGPYGAQWRHTTQTVTLAQHGATREWHVGRELAGGRIAAMMIDRAGLAWVGTNRGLAVIDSRSEEKTVTSVVALQGQSVLSLYEDTEGNHWIGTETSGLHVLRRLLFHGEPALAGAAVTAIVQTLGLDGRRSMWVGTRDDGVRERRNGLWQPALAAPALTSSVVLCMAPASDGGLWVGTPDGLNYIGERSGSKAVVRITSADGLPDDTVRSIAADPDGSIWVGTPHGLGHLHRERNQVGVQTLTTANGLGGDLIGALLLANVGKRKVLWVGTQSGLSRIGVDGRITNFAVKDGLGSPIVTALAQDRAGSIWAATQDGGLTVFDGQRFRPAPSEVWKPSRTNKVESIVADEEGSLWLRMDRGVRRIAAEGLRNCILDRRCNDARAAIASHGLAAGMPNEELVPGASATAWLAADGELWFPSRNGAAIADTRHLPTEQPAVPTVIESFLIDDVPQELHEGETKSAKLIEVPYGQSRLTMDYAGLSFLEPGGVRYRFMLEGFDNQWTEAGTRRFATYTNLPPGTYLFRVQAMGNTGGWGNEGATLRFRVVPPFYRRWWFIALMVLLFAAVLAGLYLLRLRVLRRRFDAVLAERNRMAREIHDTLTQDFVGTTLQLDILHRHLKGGHVDRAIDQVKQTRQLVTEGLEEARRSIWELRANNSQDSLPTRLARLLERETFATIAPKLQLGGAYRELDPRTEREVLRIAQEALTNVQNHAQATQTKVNLQYYNEALRLVVEDNGRGFVVEQGLHKDGHFGLLGMKERASAIGGTLDIVSEPDAHNPTHGTTLTLHLPLVAAKRS
jgi:signal transduction histidine kinase/ligand-binding sensor domain-containing protein